MLRAGLIISVVANICLVGYFVVQQDSGREPIESIENRAAYSDISAPFISDKSTSNKSAAEKALTLAQLQTKYATPNTAPALYYWQPAYKIANQFQAAQRRNAESIRNELSANYGEQVFTEATFSSFFYPLGAGFEFLTSKQQIQISGLRDEHRAGLMSIKGGFQSFIELQRKEQVYLGQVQEILSEDEFLEFQLRESQLAEQLRSIDFDWSESEFRKVYEVRAASTSPTSPLLPAGLFSSGLLSEEVKQVLGEIRYLKYLKATDPTFGQLSSQVELNGGSEQDAADAYDVYTSYGEQIIQAMQNRDLKRAQQLKTERDQIIQEKTGARVNQPPQLPFNIPQNDALKIR
tara:strand:- start:606 stop:1652 length:1047 start_codon:yes stop_codon:yes gene_type:complete